MTTGEHPPSGSHSFFHIGIKRSNSICIGQRTELRALIEGVADAQVLHAFYELAFELVCDFLRNDKALGGNAGLTVVLNSRVDGSGDRRIQISTRHHNER